MRFSTVLVVLSTAFATTSAALLDKRQSGYANCALPCLTSTNSSCNSQDTACLCHDQNFVNGTTTCFENSCSGADLEKSIEAAVEMCRAVGVTLTSSVPSSTSPPSSGESSKSTPSSPSSSPASSGSSSSSSSSSSTSSAVSNGVNVLFALSALGLIGYAL